MIESSLEIPLLCFSESLQHSAGFFFFLNKNYRKLSSCVSIAFFHFVPSIPFYY